MMALPTPEKSCAKATLSTKSWRAHPSYAVGVGLREWNQPNLSAVYQSFSISICQSFKLLNFFQLYLTSNVTAADFNMGYSMTGTLERGCKKTNTFQMTHFAVIRRKDFESGRDQKTQGKLPGECGSCVSFIECQRPPYTRTLMSIRQHSPLTFLKSFKHNQLSNFTNYQTSQRPFISILHLWSNFMVEVYSELTF